MNAAAMVRAVLFSVLAFEADRCPEPARCARPRAAVGPWAFSDKPLGALQNLMRQAGFSQEKFEINSAPTFFINGQRHPGNLMIQQIEKIIAPILGS